MKLKPVKGMQDILPEEVSRWHIVERRFRDTVALHGFKEIRTPLVELTTLFQHSTGEGTEVVEKQMFTLEKDRESLSLRPEGTPSCARAYINQTVYAREPVTRWFYLGPMFRAERPQRGRQRQFHQAGCEVYGDQGPACDAELIDMLYGFLTSLGIAGLRVSINSLGNQETRAKYREVLLSYLTPQADQLSPHARERFEANPLRVLDSKDERDQAVALGAPSILDVLDPADQAHFSGLKAGLDALGTPYEVDPKLVRGLDYYSRTTFEISAQSGELGAQNALLGGGRYDAMLQGLGGPDTPAIGFAIGLERILLAMPHTVEEPACWVSIAPLGDTAIPKALVLAKQLRQLGLPAEVDARGNSLKSMLRRANSAQARFCVVMGEAELSRGVVQLKDLRQHQQEEVEQTEVARYLKALVDGTQRGQESEAQV